MDNSADKYKVKLEHFKNIVAVAVADELLDGEERNFLSTVGRNLGMSEQEIEDILAIADTLQFVIPINQEDKEQQLVDAVYMSMIDGEVHFKEYRLCCIIAEKLDMTREDVDSVIRLTNQLWKASEK